MSEVIQHQLSLLLSAYGYNLYNDKNRLRADDLLVREKAADALAEASSTLGSLRTAYRRQFIPSPTRENPDPPPDRIEALRAIARAQEQIADLETRVRAMPVPTQDKVWERFRREKTLLSQLLMHDYELIAPSQELRDHVATLRPDAWNESVASGVATLAGSIDRAIKSRGELLTIPGG